MDLLPPKGMLSILLFGLAAKKVAGVKWQIAEPGHGNILLSSRGNIGLSSCRNIGAQNYFLSHKSCNQSEAHNLCQRLLEYDESQLLHNCTVQPAKYWDQDNLPNQHPFQPKD